MPAVLSRLSILVINDISRDLNNTKILLYNFFVRYVVVTPACVNVALVSGFCCMYVRTYLFSSRDLRPYSKSKLELNSSDAKHFSSVFISFFFEV